MPQHVRNKIVKAREHRTAFGFRWASISFAGPGSREANKVRDHLNQVIGVMKACDDMSDFNRKFGYVFKKNPLQYDVFRYAGQRRPSGD